MSSGSNPPSQPDSDPGHCWRKIAITLTIAKKPQVRPLLRFPLVPLRVSRPQPNQRKSKIHGWRLLSRPARKRNANAGNAKVGFHKVRSLPPEFVAQRPVSQETTRALVKVHGRRGHLPELFWRRGQETFRPRKKALDSFGVREGRRDGFLPL